MKKPVKASKFETVDVIYQKDDCEQYINDYLGRFESNSYRSHPGSSSAADSSWSGVEEHFQMLDIFTFRKIKYRT